MIGIVLCTAILIMLFASDGKKPLKDMGIGALLASSSPEVVEAADTPDAFGMKTSTEKPGEAIAIHTSGAAQIIAASVGEEWVAYGYMLLTVHGIPYDIIPLRDNGEFVLTQSDIGATNTIHTTKYSAWMAHSTCDNQDCVEQGIVSLDNIKERILGNMIICLPNGLMVELLTAEELAEALM